MREFGKMTAVHPGRILNDSLEFLGVSQKWLADRTGLSEKHISEILRGKASITADTAVKLSNALDGSVEFWVNLDANYRAAEARKEQEKKAEKEVKYLEKISYGDLTRVGWVPKTTKEADKVLNLYKFFGVSSLENIKLAQPAAFRRSNKEKIDEYALAAWLRRGEIVAGEKTEIGFNEKKLKDSIKIIRDAIYEQPKDIYSRITGILSKCGVCLVATEYLPKTYVNGATRWVGRNPIIELSDKGKRDDILWFTLFHEIGHILKHSKKEQFIDFEEASIGKIEKEADDFAAETLIPKEAYDRYLKNHNGKITKESIEKFAREERILPSVIVGRLKKEKKIPYSRFNDYHQKIAFKV